MNLPQNAQHPGDQRAFRQVSIPARRSRISSRSKSASANLRGLKFAYVGDGNNMCHSLLTHRRARRRACSRRHARGLRAGSRNRCRSKARRPRNAAARSKSSARPKKPSPARKPSTPTSGPAWARKQEAAEREKAFAAYQVNDALFSHAAPDAVFLHCLPAHRGSEVTDEVMDSPRSIVYDQAENRLHVQKAILHTLLT